MAEPLRPGQKLLSYRIVAELDAGGMAELFLGLDPEGRPVAIKAIRPGQSLDPTFVAMFHDEAQIISRISDENVVRLIEFGKDNDQHYLVMEYLHGVTFSAMLRRLYEMGRTLTPVAAGAIILRIARGLHAAHEIRGDDGSLMNIIHRDVSPQNMMLLADGRVKLIDFGIAKAVGRQHQTVAGEVKGKIRYMAPEQMRGEPIDRRADIYALGVVLWEILATRRLYGEATDAQVMVRATKGDISPPGAFADVPFALDRVVMQCLRAERKERYEAAHVVARAIIQALPECAEVTQQQLAELGWGVVGVDFDALAKRLPISLPTRSDVNRARMTDAVRALTQPLDAEVESTAIGSIHDYLPEEDLSALGLEPRRSSTKPATSAHDATSSSGDLKAVAPHPAELSPPGSPEADGMPLWLQVLAFGLLLFLAGAGAFLITRAL